MSLWALKIMGRLYYHIELATEEQKMIESLGMHSFMHFFTMSRSDLDVCIHSLIISSVPLLISFF